MYVGVFYLLTIDPSRSVKEKTCNILPTPIQSVQYIDCEFLPCLKAFSAGTRVFCCIFLTSNTASFPYQITGNDFIHALIATRAPTDPPPPPPPPKHFTKGFWLVLRPESRTLGGVLVFSCIYIWHKTPAGRALPQSLGKSQDILYNLKTKVKLICGLKADHVPGKAYL